MPEVQLTWLGHGTFRFDSPGGKRVYIDPWLNEPEVPRQREGAGADRRDRDHARPRRPRRKHPRPRQEVRLHGRRAGRARRLARRMKKAVAEDKIRDPNKGGTVDLDGVKVTLTHAQHSSGTIDRTTCLHGRAVRLRVRGRERDEDLLRRGHERVRRHAADQAAVRARRGDPADRRPLHDGPEGGGCRARVPRRARCVPCHYGTFPLLAGTPDQLRELAPPGVEIVEMQPGETVEV